MLPITRRPPGKLIELFMRDRLYADRFFKFCKFYLNFTLRFTLKNTPTDKSTQIIYCLSIRYASSNIFTGHY